MKSLLNEIRHTPLLWMLIFVPAVLVAETAAPHSHTLLFVLSVLAIVPLAALLSHATRAVRRTHAGVAELCRRTVTDEPAVLAGRRHHGDDCDRDGETSLRAAGARPGSSAPCSSSSTRSLR